MNSRLLKTLLLFCLLSSVCLVGASSRVSAETDDPQADDDAASAQALVAVTDQVVAEVHPGMFGNNLLAGYVYGDDGGGVWEPQGVPCSDKIIGCYNPDAYAMLEAAHTGLLRFPGGRLTKSYDWAEGVGPANTRVFYFGTDEFLFLASTLGAEPVITVSLYDPLTGNFAEPATVENAAAWAEYANSTSPYGPVRYWEVDTDPWENSTSPYNPDIEYKRVSPESYGDALLAMSQALKDIDPNILIGADSYSQGDIADTYRLLQHIVDSGVDPKYWPDYFTLGFYRPNFDKNRCDLYGVDLQEFLRTTMATTFAASRELSGHVEDVLNAITETWGGAKVQIPLLLKEFNTQLLFADLETNVPAGQPPVDCPLRNLSHSLGAAIYNADVLLTTLPFSDNLVSSAIWNFTDSDPTQRDYYGSIYLYNGDAVQRPDALILKMLGAQFHMDQIFQTNVVTSTFDSVALGQTPDYSSIAVGPDEHFIRVRVARHREPTDISPPCGPGNIYNPDTTSYINGIYGVDNFTMVRDDLPPAAQINLIVNGDFQQDLSTGWVQKPDPAGVTTSRQCDGDSCWLQLAFANAADNNPAYVDEVSQTVSVEPGRRYSLNYQYELNNLQVKTQNLLCDPSWEMTSVPGPYNNTYWVQYANTPSPAEIDTTDCYDGAQCVKVHFVDNPDYYHIRQRYYVQNNTDPELTDPASFRVQGYIRTENLDSAVTIEAQARNAADQFMQSADSYGIFGTTDWRLQSYVLKLFDRADTAFINVHLRKKAARKDNGDAWFDYIRMFRDERVYAPRVAIDVCQDADCTNKRTVETAGDFGTRGWTTERLSGTPIVSAVAGRSGDDYNLILINKDLDRTVSTQINLNALGLRDGMSIYLSRLTGDAVDATNELGASGPDYHVFLSGGEFFGTLSGSSFTVDLPPYSITGLKVVNATIIGDDEWPDDDTNVDDDDTDDDITPDDDTVDDDTLADDDVDDDSTPHTSSDHGGDNGCCGC